MHFCFVNALTFTTFQQIVSGQNLSTADKRMHSEQYRSVCQISLHCAQMAKNVKAILSEEHYIINNAEEDSKCITKNSLTASTKGGNNCFAAVCVCACVRERSEIVCW